ADQRPVHAQHRRGQSTTRWCVHERHELVRESGHGAADADATDVGATADTVHPAAFGDVAVHHRTPAADLHLALRPVVVVCEVRLFVVGRTVAPLVHGLAEQPLGT